MQKILSKFRRRERSDADIRVSKDSTDESIAIQQVFQYRKQKGVNLGTFSFYPSYLLSILPNAGSWFVLERWIADSPFQHALQPAQSDLDVARGINAKQILERHWDAWMTEEDWVWISEHGINTVRIPVSCLLLMNIKVISPLSFYLTFHRLATIISVELILLFFVKQISNRFRRCTQARGPGLSEQSKQPIVMG